MEEFDREIQEDIQLLASLPPAIQAQRNHIKSLEETLRSAKRILNHMLLSRRDLKKHLQRTKARKSAYPSRMRRYSREHFGEIWDRIEKQSSPIPLRILPV